MREIPALRQSHMELMSCELAYATVVIEGKNPPASVANDRGNDVHETMWEYITWCAEKGIPSDWAALDRFALKRGVEARQILRNLREGYVVDHRNHLGAELTLYLDENFQPCDEEDAWYEGTIDHLMAEQSEGLIDDFKTHPGPFEPDTPQGHMYPLLVFQSYAHIDVLQFRLIFVRYRKCFRAKTVTREQVPQLVEYITSFKERQIDLHQRYAKGPRELKATPGPHCQYCPKLADVSCPVAEFNPQATHTPEERLQFKIWAAQLSVQNNQVLKSYVGATEKNVVVTDGNGSTYEFGAWPSISLRFPLEETYQKLLRWRGATGEDLMPALVVGATDLKAKLKAFKRKDLADELANVADPVPGAKWGIRRDGKAEPEEDE